MTIPLTYAAVAARRNPPALPFGWGAVTVLLIGALFTIIGIVIILYAFFSFITGTVGAALGGDRKSTRLNSSHSQISYAGFCLKTKVDARTGHLLIGSARGSYVQGFARGRGVEQRLFLQHYALSHRVCQ